MKQVATREKVFAVCAALSASQPSFSVDDVVSLVGGSKATVVALVREWRAASVQPNDLLDPAAADGIVAECVSAIKRPVEMLAARLTADFERRLAAQERAHALVLDADRAALADHEAHIAAMLQDIEATRARAEEHERRCVALDAELQRARVAGAELRERMVATERALAERAVLLRQVAAERDACRLALRAAEQALSEQKLLVRRARRRPNSTMKNRRKLSMPSPA